MTRDFSFRAGDLCIRIACGKVAVAACLPHSFAGCREHMTEHDSRCSLEAAHPDDCCRAALRERDAAWAKLLFLHHGCSGPALYGDDGEMQCKVCGIDFRRMSPEDIAGRWRMIALHKLEAASRAEPRAAAPEALSESRAAAQGEEK